ncbi:MAG: carboxymuconolactone decarboxylase family protein [Rhodospirillales bacterium]
MLNWLLRRRIAAFETRYDYDMGYAREILATDRGAFMKLGGLMGFSAWRRDVPPAAYFAASIAATAAEDCGPCTQLIVTMAEHAGVSAATLHAVLRGDVGAMGEDAALGWQFAREVSGA